MISNQKEVKALQKQEIIKTFKILTDEKPNFFIQQFYTQCIAEAAYYIESDGIAMVIDPLRDTFPYTMLARERKASLRYCLLTHFHADFVSGHLDLQKKLNTEIVYGPTAKPNFKATVAKHEDIIQLGKIQIQVLHTPGHTMESSTFLLLDGGKPYCIFTGDTLFLGEVGRPDLAVKANEITKEDLAGFLYDSLNNVIKPLPDNVIVYPNHGAGSACGKNIQQGTSDTLGNQKKTNYALLIKDKEEFIKTLTSNLPTPPPYFFHDATLNKQGYEILHELMEKHNVPIPLKQYKKYMKEGYIIIDTRDRNIFLQGFIKGSLAIDLKAPFAAWIGKLLKAQDKYIALCTPGQEYETIVRMARVGFDNCVGFLEGGFKTWQDAKEEIGSAKNIDMEEFQQLYNNKKETDFFLDVREENEKNKGYLENFDGQCGMWGMENALKENPQLFDKNKTIYCMCQGGQRSISSISILAKHGFTNICNIAGGMDAIKQTPLPVKYAESTCS